MSTSELFPLQNDEYWDLSHPVKSLVVVDIKTLKTTLRPRLVGLLSGSGSGSSGGALPNGLVGGAFGEEPSQTHPNIGQLQLAIL